MKKNILKRTTFILAAATAFSACDSYLDKQPSASSNAPITEASQLLSLYDNTSNTEERSYPDSYASDDYGIPVAMFDSYPSKFQSTEACFYALIGEVMESSASNSTWAAEYAKIFTANTIIESATSVNGTEAEINEVLCNGHFLRAWSYFRLATIHCLPYSEANKEKLGLPLRLGTLFTENISRATLGKTFEQIFSDLQEAERLCIVDKPRPNYTWRTSKCAIYGLYARLYLYMNDYANALTYADKALALAPELYNYNNLEWANPVEYAETADMPAQTLYYSETHSWTSQKIYRWPEWAFIRLSYLGSQWFCPSQELLDCYEDKENDLRYDHFFVEHGNRRFSVPYDWFRYDLFNDGSYCISGLGPAEFILTKAEAQARQGSWQDALLTLQPLREARFKTGKATALNATSQSEALKEILKERRREIPFAIRLMDLKRFAVSATPDDDVTIQREFYMVKASGVDSSKKIQITAKGDDPRLAIPIPLEDIQNSQGAIEQNPF